MSTVDAIVPTDTLRGVGRRVLGAPLRTRTYCHLLYLVLAAPLGVVYGVGLVTGTAVGVGLLVTWVGLPILLATVAGAATAGQYRIGSWTVRSLPEAVAVAAVGALVFSVGLSLLSALARVHARSTAAILRVGPGR